MKKGLFILCLGLGGMISAQNAPVQPSRVVRAKMLLPAYNSPKAENGATRSVTNAQNVTHHSKRVGNAQSFTKVYIGSAQNMFGIITAACTQVTVNQSLGMIALTHRESNSLPYGSGAYETDYSLDGGNTWDTAKAVVFREANNSSTAGTRYPNGVILNPNGNTNATLAYAITNGPHTNGTSWDSVGFGSIRLDSSYTNQNEVRMYPNVNNLSTLNVFSPPHYMTVTDDSIVHSVEDAWSLNSANTTFYGFYGAVVNKGTWNGATHNVTWTDTVLKPVFASYAGPSAAADSDAEVQEISMAWSQDGSVGYVVFFANLDSTGYDFASLQPVVYKSTDHGHTWAMMPVFNFATIPNLVQYLRPTLDSGNRLPFWDIVGDSGGYYAGHDVDLTVDANYNLHIFGAIESGAIANPDSGGYSYNPAFSGGRYIYDVYTTTASGGWKATFLDSLVSPLGVSPPNTLWSSNADGALTWGARIQASRSTDGKKVFCTWLDDFNADEQIISPDIVTMGIDVNTSKKTKALRVTNDGVNYFLQVSDIAYQNGSCWEIPCVVALDPSPQGGLTPMEFWYVQGATLCDSDFVNTGVAEITNSTSGFSISPNYPNPFNITTQFNIGLTKNNLVSVDVFNLFGQKVYSIPAQQMSSGDHLMTINAKGWSAGVYFYRVTVGDQSKTQKMVVQ